MLGWLARLIGCDDRACGATRSSRWPKVRAAFLKTNGRCAVCGRADSLEVHHKQPFHLRPELELDWSNLVTLCDGATRCHFVFGHFGNWQRFNPAIDADVATWSVKFAKG